MRRALGKRDSVPADVTGRHWQSAALHTLRRERTPLLASLDVMPRPAQQGHFSSCVCLQIVVMDKLDYCATLNNLAEIKRLKNFTFVKGSIQSLDLVSHVLETEKIDTVMHFAAQVRLGPVLPRSSRCGRPDFALLAPLPRPASPQTRRT